ncbi:MULTISPECIES: hypothetical protein [Pseudomonas]|uniref:Uncharacterized protein n=1 Tax=Pseudomonas aphyarum TaxID=2942629 RepID=A0ABT5PUL1_9PSED|nr:hypothetical protein [Pseudomonas aphyarum]MDD0968075.1 hypothetical protein [Pseudomonas aphyarum]MDD1127593.1 hypothetical protein [Pseudomonas aphyarum]
MNLETLVNWNSNEHGDATYDIFLAFFNSEKRSIDYATKMDSFCERKIVVCQSEQWGGQVPGELGFSIVDVKELAGIFSEVSLAKHGRLSILVDISCMSRHCMAEFMSAMFAASNCVEVKLRVNYTIAQYSLPPLDISANESIEAVHGDFSGWSYADSKPTSLILGLGYEPFKAEGASEYFEPYDQWVFVPESPVKEYLPMVLKNNEELLFRSADDGKTIFYKVDDPELTFGQLEQVVSLLSQSTNPVLMPFGPKILFLLCLIQSRCHPEVGVWCVTGNHPEDVLSSTASDYSCGLDCCFSAGAAVFS